MSPLSLGELATIVGGQAIGERNTLVTGFATDSNAVSSGDLFIAIRGSRVDGHDFVPAALQRGACAALVERSIKGSHIRVRSVVDALADLGRHFRSKFSGPVVGVTGSAGKTTTKEFVAAALAQCGPVLKSQGNRNTEFTSPLLWTDLTSETKAVIVEMAMRGFGQIGHLASIAKPNIGIVTNVGYAHLGQVGSREGIAMSKAELLRALPPEGTAVLWNECEFLDFLREESPEGQARTFGFEDVADCRITSYTPLGWDLCIVEGECDGKHWRAELGSVGRHVALDAAAAVLTAQVLGLDVEEAAAALSTVSLPPMRMEIRRVGGATVLLDTYNASPPSMISAIETLTDMPVKGRRMAVLGEMRELGEYTEPGHRAVGDALRRSRLDSVLFVGDGMRFAREQLGNGSYREGTLADAKELLNELHEGDVVLIKGSRALELERALDGDPT